MSAIHFIRGFCVRPRPRDALATEMPFAAADRATRKAIQDRQERLGAARRYWACPF
jgi:hypothetical protein